MAVARWSAAILLTLVPACGGADGARAPSKCDWCAPAAYLKASNADPRDYFGHAVALSADGSTLAVGAPWESSAATAVNGDEDDNSLLWSGAVYVFARVGDSWAQEAYLKASNTGDEDSFGHSVALSADGNTLVVGAWGEDSAATGVNGNGADDSAPASGAAYVFTRSANLWSQEAYIKASNADPGDQFGHAVALSADGRLLAVGAYGESSAAVGVNGDQFDNSALGSGAVYVFNRGASSWSQQAYLKPSNTNGGGFGHAVAISGDGSTLAAGAWYEASAARGVNGNQSDTTAPASGAVYVFTGEGGLWLQEAYLKASNTNAGDWFGYSATLSGDGDTLAVGAWGESSAATGVNGNQDDNSALGAGAAYVFGRTNSAWSQQAYVKASNGKAQDQFGHSVALSSDGLTLAVGAWAEDGGALSADGREVAVVEESGAVYAYRRSSTSWHEAAYIKAQNPDPGDFFGASVALSAGGLTLAASAVYESGGAMGVNGNQADNSAPESGAVYVYMNR